MDAEDLEQVRQSYILEPRPEAIPGGDTEGGPMIEVGKAIFKALQSTMKGGQQSKATTSNANSDESPQVLPYPSNTYRGLGSAMDERLYELEPPTGAKKNTTTPYERLKTHLEEEGDEEDTYELGPALTLANSIIGKARTKHAFKNGSVKKSASPYVFQKTKNKVAETSCDKISATQSLFPGFEKAGIFDDLLGDRFAPPVVPADTDLNCNDLAGKSDEVYVPLPSQKLAIGTSAPSQEMEQRFVRQGAMSKSSDVLVHGPQSDVVLQSQLSPIRTTVPFHPSRLLCKRFGVSPQAVAEIDTQTLPVVKKELINDDALQRIAGHLYMQNAASLDRAHNEVIEGPRAEPSLFDAIFGSGS